MIFSITALFGLVLAFVFVREAWFGYPPTSHKTRMLSRKETAILEASADTLFPVGGSLPSAAEAGVVEYVDRFMRDLPSRHRILVRLLFVFIEHGSMIFGPVHRRLTRQDLVERIMTFKSWEYSNLYFRRLSFLSLRTMLTFAYFGDARVLSELQSARP